MPKINFETNKPQTVTLRAIEGTERESQFGGVQHLFTAREGYFYVSAAVGGVISAQLRKLGVQAGETVEICKCEVDAGRGRKQIQWQVAFPAGEEPAPVGEQPDGTLVIPAPPAPKPVAVAQKASEAPATLMPWQEYLLRQTTCLVDVYAAALQHASSMHGGSVRPETVQSILLSAFINLSKSGGSSTHVAVA